MGVGYQGLQLALLAKRRGVDFRQTITLGRQNHFLDSNTLASMFQRFGLVLSEQDQQDVLRDAYSEGLFKKLGADTVDSIDASDYEQASIIHDLNKPLDSKLVQAYTCAIDFGSLEHVFNFPVALKNATDLVQTGGHFLSATTANNFMGHGFYQFSPELFFSYLSRNGFADIEIYLIPFRIFPYFFRVTDPRDLGGRVELVNAEPVLMGVIAKKVEHVPEMSVPLQSDYCNQLWSGRDTNRANKMPPVSRRVAAVAKRMKSGIDSAIKWSEAISPSLVYGFENALHYELMDPSKD